VRILVDVERCRGAGQCTRSAPEVFDQDEEDGTVIVLDDEPPPALHQPSSLQFSCAQTPSSGWRRLEARRSRADCI